MIAHTESISYQAAWFDVYVRAPATCRLYKVFYYIQIHLPIANAVRGTVRSDLKQSWQCQYQLHGSGIASRSRLADAEVLPCFARLTPARMLLQVFARAWRSQRQQIDRCSSRAHV
jgi:hypothetical protein